MKKKYKIVIDRSKWRTGHDSGNATGKGKITALLNEEGCKCCLGFIAQQITKKGIFLHPEPSDCNFSIPYLNKNDQGYYYNTDLSTNAISINDSDIPLKEKEVALKKLFKDTPISLTFKGRAVPYNE